MLYNILFGIFWAIPLWILGLLTPLLRKEQLV